MSTEMEKFAEDLRELVKSGESSWIEITKEGMIRVIQPGYELRLDPDGSWYIYSTDGG